MDNKASITALMSSFGRAFHAENETHPVFADNLAKELMTEEEYAAVQGYLLGGAQFFEPKIAPADWEPKELLRRRQHACFRLSGRELLCCFRKACAEHHYDGKSRRRTDAVGIFLRNA